MAKGKKKKVERKVVKPKVTEDEDSYSLRNRRSSMRVNLSYISNLSDSGNGSLKRTRHEADESALVKSSVQKDGTVQATKRRRIRKDNVNENTPTSTNTTNVTVIEAPLVSPGVQQTEDIETSPITIMKEKEQQLNRSCRQLRDAIMNKTQALFDKRNELAIKTSEVLATGCTLAESKVDEVTDADGSKTPTVKMNIGKNDQIVMSGDGKKKNPVQVNSMLRRICPEEELNVSSEINEKNEDCNHSIVSTPKKPRVEEPDKKSSHKIPRPVIKIPVARLFTDDPNNSMSNMNAPPILVCNKNPGIHQHASNKSNTHEASSDPNYTTSPILSQGARRSRFLRLSLKKKLTQRVSNTSLRLSVSTTNESFVKQFPLTCSSFKERQAEKNDKTIVNNEDTVDTIASCNLHLSNNKDQTICLEEDMNISKTIVISGDDDKTVDIDNSNNKTVEVQSSAVGSRMEITGVSSNMPIISRSFQHVIRRSLNLDHIPEKLSQSLSNTIQKQLSSNQYENKLIDNEAASQQKATQQSMSAKDSSEELHVNTLPTSLSVNTSLNQINSQEQVAKSSNRSNESENVMDSDNADQILERADTEIIHPQTSDDDQSPTEDDESSNAAKSLRSHISINEKKRICKKRVTRHKKSSLNIEKESSDEIITGPSTCSIRSSLRVNTSLDSVKKSPPTNKGPDFSEILTMMHKSTSQVEQGANNEKSNTSKDHSSYSELENISLLERIKKLSAQKKAGESESFSRVSVKVTRLAEDEIPGPSYRSKKSANEICNTIIDNNTSQPKNNNSKSNPSNKRRSSSTVRKSSANENVSSTTESSVVETTPYPASRSVLMKTMIKNSIAINSLDPRKFVDFSDSDDSENRSQTSELCHPALEKQKNIHSQRGSPGQPLTDTVLLNSSDESPNESNQRVGCIIDETLDKSKNSDSSSDDKMNSKKENRRKNRKSGTVKRKLFPLRENSQLVSFSPADVEEPQQMLEVTEKVKPRKRRKVTQQKKQNKKETTLNSPELVNETETPELETQPKPAPTPKKPRKIVRKKIVVKKVHNMTLLNNIIAEGETSQFHGRTSSAEFDLSKNRRKKKKKENPRKNNKIVIVITGLPKQDKDLIKSVIKALGSATLEFSVTPRTTHVVSSGIRTINLLKAIIRGCWLLSMEWVLRSLEENKWLDPNPFEMIHFSKAVQENRRDRQLFGKAYVPELFVTCGLIYVENGTTPPPPVLKDLIKIAGGRITEDCDLAQVVIGSEGLKENWILDCITTGEMQSFDLYKQG